MKQMESVRMYLGKLPFWNQMARQEQDFVQENSVVRSYAKGQLIYASNADCLGMTMVLSGSVRTCILSEEGREITLFRLYPGDTCMLSASCVVEAITFDTEMMAEEDCELLVIRAAAFERLAQQNIYARCFMYEVLCERFSSVMWAMQNILFKGYDRRLAEFLISEYDRTGRAEIKMTHEQIAQHTNSAREVVARMLKRFASDRLIEFKRGSITLKNIEELRKLNGE